MLYSSCSSGSPLLLLLQVLYHEVATHPQDQEDDGGDDLGQDTHAGGVTDESEEEAHGLLEPVVGEGRLLVVGKETSIEGVDQNITFTK